MSGTTNFTYEAGVTRTKQWPYVVWRHKRLVIPSHGLIAILAGFGTKKLADGNFERLLHNFRNTLNYTISYTIYIIYRIVSYHIIYQYLPTNSDHIYQRLYIQPQISTT
jgi:hypothetical protein